MDVSLNKIMGFYSLVDARFFILSNLKGSFEAKDNNIACSLLLEKLVIALRLCYLSIALPNVLSMDGLRPPYSCFGFVERLRYARIRPWTYMTLSL